MALIRQITELALFMGVPAMVSDAARWWHRRRQHG